MATDNDQQPDTVPALATAPRDDLGGVTEAQARFIAAALDGTIEVAAKAVGLSKMDAASTLRSKAVRRSMHDARSRRLKGDIANKAVRTLDSLMDASNPPAVRLGAVKLALELSGHTAEADTNDRRTLGEMTAQELADVVAQVDRQIEAIGDKARPVGARSAG